MKTSLWILILMLQMITGMIVVAKEITELQQRVYSLEYRFDKEIKK